MPLTPPESTALAAIAALVTSPGAVALVMLIRKAAVDDETLKQVPITEKALDEHKADDLRVHAELLSEIRNGFQNVTGDLREVKTDVGWLKRERGGK